MKQSRAMSLVESLAIDLDPTAFTDHYADALEAVIAEKVASGTAVAADPRNHV